VPRNTGWGGQQYAGKSGFCLVLGLFALNSAATAAPAQSWPSRPVKVIMATAAGSAPDVIARVVTDRLAQLWGQQVLILNRPGAGGLIAMQALAAAERDGHTLYWPSSSSLVVLPETNPKLPIDIAKDLIPIGLVGEQPFLIVANNTLGVNTLPELIALAKQKPGELTYAANFRGSLPNMTTEMLKGAAKIDVTFVPYPGAPQGLQDVLGGRVSMMVEGIAAFIGPMASNSVKPLAVTSRARLPNYPNLATVAETLPGFQSRGWFVVIAPAPMPDDVVRKINADLRTVLDQSEVRARFETGATYVRHMSPVETGKYIRDEMDAWRPIAKQFAVAPK
jgi:tripartite-type tricarboxylate transporter receptor subunit TctC